MTSPVASRLLGKASPQFPLALGDRAVPDSPSLRRLDSPTKPIIINKHVEQLKLFVEPSDVGDLHIFAGSASRELAAEIAAKLNMQPGRASLKRFADGEVSIQVHDNIRGNDVFIVQSTSPPVNDSLMELILLVSTLRRSSVKSITAVMPYFGYGRQHMIRDNHLETIAASDVCRMLEAAGVDRVISVDLHAGQIQGFFDIPTDNLFSAPYHGARY